MKHNGTELTYTFERYMNGGVAVQLWCDEGPYTMATVWVPGLKAREIAIKDYSENIGIYQALLDDGFISPAHRYVETGYVSVPVCYYDVDRVLAAGINDDTLEAYEDEVNDILCTYCRIPDDEKFCSDCVGYTTVRDALIKAREAVKLGKDNGTCA